VVYLCTHNPCLMARDWYQTCFIIMLQPCTRSLRLVPSSLRVSLLDKRSAQSSTLCSPAMPRTNLNDFSVYCAIYEHRVVAGSTVCRMNQTFQVGSTRGSVRLQYFPTLSLADLRMLFFGILDLQLEHWAC